ncbi:MAG: GGDEF domain-containing protein [Nakamurella sp.]
MLRSRIAIAAERSELISAAIADADFFKRINDELSHEVGDEVLRRLAAILAAAASPPEVVGRLGGEELLIVLPNTDEATAFDRCETIRRAIAAYDFAPITHHIPVTVSIGVATARGAETTSAALLTDADRNLYAAKRSGRNRVMTARR